MAFGLVAAAHLLLVLMLLRLAPPPAEPPSAVTAFELLPDIQERTRAVAAPKTVTKRSPRQQQVPPPAVELPSKIEGLIELTREEFAAADIGKLPSHRETAAEEAPGHSAADAATGPNGEHLYNAEWHRRPTQAELAYYLPAAVPRPGWAMIACQTVDDYRVDNCIELGQSHPGTSLAAGIRQAAWQFRVLPPRIGGRPLVGAWVRIRIDFTNLPAG